MYALKVYTVHCTLYRAVAWCIMQIISSTRIKKSDVRGEKREGWGRKGEDLKMKERGRRREEEKWGGEGGVGVERTHYYYIGGEEGRKKSERKKAISLNAEIL